MGPGRESVWENSCEKTDIFQLPNWKRRAHPLSSQMGKLRPRGGWRWMRWKEDPYFQGQEVFDVGRTIHISIVNFSIRPA